MQRTTVWVVFFLLILSPLGFPILAGAQIFTSQGQSYSLRPGQVEHKVWDPLQRSNKKVFQLNDRLYSDVVMPVTTVYKRLPSSVRKVVRNGFQNLEDPSRFVNLFLQGRSYRGGEELTRFIINSTAGVGGMFDVAQNVFGIKDCDADFGQTLGMWYVGPGPYLVIPALGPSDARDFVGLAVEHVMDPLFWVPGPFWLMWPVDCVKYTSEASDHIGEYEAMKKASLDPYVAMRNAYMQHRRAMIEGSSPQPEVVPAGVSSPGDNARQLTAYQWRAEQEAADQKAARIAKEKALAEARAEEQLKEIKPIEHAAPRVLAKALRKAAKNQSSPMPFKLVVRQYPQLAGAVAARNAIAKDADFRPDWGQDNRQRLRLATQIICRDVARGDRFARGRDDSSLARIKQTACDQQRKLANKTALQSLANRLHTQGYEQKTASTSLP